MAEIKDFNREVIINAISEIKNNPEKRNGRESTTYDLVYEGENYPPILVLSVANKLSGGSVLTLSDFNNSTDKAFNILREKGFVIETKKSVENSNENFLEVVSKLGFENSVKFFDLLETLTYRLNLNPEDPRVVFSVRNDHGRLAFTIGQRYCLVLENTKDKNWGFITPKKSQIFQSEKYEGSTEAYWNKTNTFSDLKSTIDEIVSACLKELERTNKSSFLKYNDSFFEKVVFDQTFRAEIMKDLFNSGENESIEPFHDTLEKFLKQAKTDNLKTAH